MNYYFDFHMHPTMKSYLSDYRPDMRENCWKTFDNILSPMLRSQASLRHLQEGRVALGIAILHAVERPLTSSFLLDHVAHIITPLHEKMLDHTAYADYREQILAEGAHLKLSLEHVPSNNNPVRILNNITEYKEDQLNLILAIEGGHCLESYNTSIPESFRALKQSGLRFLYLTLCHFTHYPLATQAYAMTMLRNNDQFKPGGFGLTPLGKEVIDIAYDKNIGHRTFIDIKHMSVVSRFQFYQYRRDNGYEDIPILATHMGVTGISRDPRSITKYFSRPAVRRDDFIEVSYDRPRGIGRGLSDRTHFNPWSINLYDEDITEVLDSGGLIGLNLDQRILGAKPVQGEYFGARDLNFILSGYRDPGYREDIAHGAFQEDEQEGERDINERKHLRHLCNNILHIVKAGGERAWKQLCIGSDFDGLINPINYCNDATEFPKLENGLLEMLPEMMEEDRGHEYNSSDMEEKVRGVMYGNALRFLNKYFR